MGYPALDSGSVAAQSSFCSRRARFLATGDEDPVRLDRGELFLGAQVAEATVEHYLARSEAKALQLGGGLGQERVLAQVAGAAGRGQDEAPRPGLVFCVTSQTWAT